MIENNNVYKKIAIALLVIGFLSGIVLGGLYADDKNDFQISLAIVIWLITLFTALPMFAVHSICYRLDLLINKKEK